MDGGLRFLLLLDQNLLDVIRSLKTSVFFERGDRLLIKVGRLGCLLKLRRCFYSLDVVEDLHFLGILIKWLKRLFIVLINLIAWQIVAGVGLINGKALMDLHALVNCVMLRHAIVLTHLRLLSFYLLLFLAPGGILTLIFFRGCFTVVQTSFKAGLSNVVKLESGGVDAAVHNEDTCVVQR